MTVSLAVFLSLTTQLVRIDNNRNLRCGSHCLYVGLKSLDVSVRSFEEFEKIIGQPGKHGYSMDDLSSAAQKLGAHALGVETTLDNLTYRKGRFACIALLERGHFVNVYDVDRDKKRVWIIDPPEKREMQADAFQAIWTKKALLISDKPLESEESIRPPLNLALIGGVVVGVICVVLVGLKLLRARAVASVVLLLVFVAGCQPKSNPPAASGGVPRIVVESEVIDLAGDAVDGGTRLDATARISNEGTAPLRILAVKTSCGCTVVRTPAPIAPGASDTLHVHVSAGYDSGPRASRIAVQTNDPQRPTVELSVRWLVGGSLQLDPGSLDLGRLRPGRKVSESVRASLAPKRADARLKVSGVPESLDVRWHADHDRGTDRELLVESNGKQDPGVYHATLEISDETGKLLSTLRIKWEVAAPLSAIPPAWFAGGVKPGQTLRRRFLIQSEEGDFSIREASVADYRAEAVEFDRGARRASRQAVELEVRAPERPGIVRFTLKVETDIEGAEKLVVPCSLVVSG